MQTVGVTGGIQEVVAHRSVAVQVPREEIGDILPVVVVDRMTQGGAVHPDVEGVAVDGNAVGRRGQDPPEVDIPAAGGDSPLSRGIDGSERLGGVSVVHGDGLRPQVRGFPLLVHRQGVDLVDPVPVGKEVGQEHDSPSAAAV